MVCVSSKIKDDIKNKILKQNTKLSTKKIQYKIQYGTQYKKMKLNKWKTCKESNSYGDRIMDVL